MIASLTVASQKMFTSMQQDFLIKKQSIFTIADLKLFVSCFLQPLGMHCSKSNYIISSILQMLELGLEKGK